MRLQRKGGERGADLSTEARRARRRRVERWGVEGRARKAGEE